MPPTKRRTGGRRVATQTKFERACGRPSSPTSNGQAGNGAWRRRRMFSPYTGRDVRQDSEGQRERTCRAPRQIGGAGAAPPPPPPPPPGEGGRRRGALALPPGPGTPGSDPPSPLWGGVRGGGATRRLPGKEMDPVRPRCYLSRENRAGCRSSCRVPIERERQQCSVIRRLPTLPLPQTTPLSEPPRPIRPCPEPTSGG